MGMLEEVERDRLGGPLPKSDGLIAMKHSEHIYANVVQVQSMNPSDLGNLMAFFRVPLQTTSSWV